VTNESANTKSKADNPFSYLNEYQFIRLTTFRKSGVAVPTTVWFGQDNGRLYVTTMNTAGKIKRIRNNGHVLLAPCDRTGQTILGKEIEAHAHLLSKSEFGQAHASLAAKYGEQFTAITARALPSTNMERVYFAIGPV